jgi:FkbM family methyltransferase
MRPDARIIAFEANPFLYQRMMENPNLRDRRIEVLPFAISDKNGVAHFHVTDVDYDNAQAKNPGTSSLLLHEGLMVKEVIEVSTRRIDEFLLSEFPRARNVALWIDAEGAEYEILQGMTGIKDRVVAIHVETSHTPMRVGQKVYSEVKALMDGLGFFAVGDDIPPWRNWGDAVFIRKDVPATLGFRYHLCRAAGCVSYGIRANFIGGILKNHCNPLYQVLSHLYTKLFS